jgi:hypothetical protein
MTCDAVIAILRAHEAPCVVRVCSGRPCSGRPPGARRPPTAISTFWSRFDPSARVDLYDCVGITQFIAELFAVRVGVADHAMLPDPVRQTAEPDAVYAF